MTTDRLTVLLVPPPGDTALLADEAGGGAVPSVYCCGCGRWLHSGCSSVWFDERRRALLLALDGVPVAMGCDRMCRWATEKAGTAPMLRYSLLEVENITHRVGKLTSARVVLLRDGREVTE